MQKPGLFSQFFITSGEGGNFFEDKNFTDAIKKTGEKNATTIIVSFRSYLDRKAEELVYKCKNLSIPVWLYYLYELGSDHPCIVLRIKALIEEDK